MSRLLSDYLQRLPGLPGIAAHFHNGYRGIAWHGPAWARCIAEAQSRLAKAGCRPGDRVALVTRGDWRQCAWALGAMAQGLTVMPLDPWMPAPAAAESLRRFAPRCGIGDGSQLDACRAAGSISWLNLRQLSWPGRAGGVEAPGLHAAQAALCLPTADGTDAVDYSLDQLDATVDAVLSRVSYTAQTRILSALPLHEGPGWILGVWLPMRLGATAHLAPGAPEGDLLRASERLRPDVIVLPARLLERIHARIWARARQQGREFALKHAFEQAKKKGVQFRDAVFRHLYQQFGGGPESFVTLGGVSNADVDAFFTDLGIAIRPCFGSADTALLLSIAPEEGPAAASVGTALTPVTVRVKEDRRLHVSGAIIGKARSAPVMDGFRMTRQFGEADASGNLTLLGGVEECLGHDANRRPVFAARADEILRRQPGVRDAAAFVLPRAGDAVNFATVLLEDERRPVSDVVAAANRELPSGAGIEEFSLWPRPRLPRLPTGELERERVRAFFQDLEGAAARPENDDAFMQALRDCVPRMARSVAPETALAAGLQLDAFGRAACLAMLESRFGCEIDDAAVPAGATVRQLREAVGPVGEFRRASAAAWAWHSFALGIREAGYLALTRWRARDVPAWLTDAALRQLADLHPAVWLTPWATPGERRGVWRRLPAAARRRLAVVEWRGGNHSLTYAWSERLALLLQGRVPVRGDTALRHTLRQLGAVLDRGCSLWVMPAPDAAESPARLAEFLGVFLDAPVLRPEHANEAKHG